MKRFKLCGLAVILALITGCAGMHLTGSTTNQAAAYLAGKGTAVGIYKIKPQAAPEIEQQWMDMMGRSYGLMEVPATEILGFFNGIILKQVPKLANDKYGFAGDLAFFLTLYGAEINPDSGEIISIKPVPMAIMKAFQTGYEGGRSVALAAKINYDELIAEIDVAAKRATERTGI